ncbi:type II toxin-antitoxin system YafQ family toxin [Candidatus Nomurabacteria bacterium]|nr:type II toxin-antitoxin system YafQ family toxin [Candidatus Nomurabacteria bacterium]
MYILRRTRDFNKSYKRLERSGKLNKKMIAEADHVVRLLLAGEQLPPKYKDHQLQGKLKGYRECHIRYDILLMYQIIENSLVLLLVDIGTHADIFD